MAMTPLEELRHSTAHVLATAVLRLWPDALLDIGPPTDAGFYYDFDLSHRFSDEDFAKIEAEMEKVVKENQPFTRKEVTRAEAKAFFEGKKQGYKIGRLGDIPEGEAISFYTNGEFTDLCAGTHVKSTGEIKAFKLLRLAGAYHRGDEKNKMLQRIYGTAYPSKEELEASLKAQEEALQRDHRKLGKELDLFLIDDEVGQGLVMWTPNGAIVRHEMQKFLLEELGKRGYEQVFTPHIGRLGLYRTSGHFPYYQESQYPPLVDRETMEKLAKEGCSCAELSNKITKGEIEGYLLKPMNCPMHIRIYASRPRSYRDLPVRLAEFGTVYRWEQSGELNGMTRVRGFTQDDAHLFCTEEQVAKEVEGCLEMVRLVLDTLGIGDFRVRVGLRDPASDKYVGSKDGWDKAEKAVKEAAKKLGVKTSEEPGEAAFYGPKIDFVVKDVIGREWQLGTVQVDYNLPERFDLTYTGADNQKHRPVMVHRAPFGSLERFTGVLIEHFRGAFPVWLAPEQARFLPVNDQMVAYAEKCAKEFQAAGLRVSVDRKGDKLGAQIRRGQLEKVPFLLVCGNREAEAGQVAVRSREKGDEGAQAVATVKDRIVDLVKRRVS
ncbi:MAG: threonine--tRNA ligase [Verrucomicrobia bacterium]|nr:threonine--tRNA ligase [Verrucomicrobiota bacterium]